MATSILATTEPFESTERLLQRLEAAEMMFAQLSGRIESVVAHLEQLAQEPDEDALWLLVDVMRATGALADRGIALSSGSDAQEATALDKWLLAPRAQHLVQSLQRVAPVGTAAN